MSAADLPDRLGGNDGAAVADAEGPAPVLRLSVQAVEGLCPEHQMIKAIAGRIVAPM
jgi:hypothetical protein